MMRIKINMPVNLNLETESKINLLVFFKQRFVTESKLSLIFTKTLLFSHKAGDFLNDSHDSTKCRCQRKFPYN